MKKAKKIVALLLCAVLLIGASVAGTLAYLTAKTSVTNTFIVGSVSFDATNALDEAIVDEYGVVVTGNGAGRTTNGNRYKLIPGRTYTKDPIIHVGANSEACWLFVKVENGIADIEADATTGDDPYTKIAEQITSTQYGWTKLDGEDNIYYKEASATGASSVDYPVFGEFRLKDNATVADYANAKIIVTAYAIQKDGLSVTEAWAALKEAYPDNT